jgi:hypothetical protein
MSTARGIFETFANQSSKAEAPPTTPQASPFSMAASAPSPFAVAAAAAPTARKDSPFAIVSEENVQDDSKTIRLPERRKAPESPFQISEPQGFGFEAPAPQTQPVALKATALNPNQPAPPQHGAAPSPFTMEPPVSSPQPAASPFGGWPQAEATPRQEAPASAPAPEPARPAAFAPPSEQPQYRAPEPAPAPQPQPVAPAPANSSNSDSYEIKQLELRAIFGVDREMTHDEIIQRSRSLPGIRQIARVSESDIAAVDALKQVISNLGFGNNPLKLYSGSVPIEFIREGKTLLAVQTDGGFAPGVRETLMLVARELSR